MLQIGRINTLEVYRFVDFGVYLDGEQYGPILLPKRYVPQGIDIGDMVDVFIYLDSEDRLIATTETPLVQVNEFAYLSVKQVTNFGAFLEWGLTKDLFVPFREQKTAMKEGEKHWVFVFLDKKTDRIVASAKIDSFMLPIEQEYEDNDEISIQIHSKTDLGYKVIIEHKFWGLLYENEIFEKIEIGESRKAYIKQIRNDGKIDVVLTKQGFVKTEDFKDKILRLLQEYNGFLPLHDKSSPEQIMSIAEMSKKSFKITIGILYKAGRIVIESDGIRLV